MESKKAIQLIKGQFTPEEASDVLLNLVNHKINFHELKNFGSKERYGEPDLVSIERIEGLRMSKLQLEEIIQEARNTNSLIQVNSVIQVVLQPAMEAQH